MTDRGLPLPTGDRSAPVGPRASWATAINETVESGNVAVTLLAASIVPDLLRVSAVVGFRGRSDVRLDHVPELTLAPSGGTSLRLIAASAVPHGDITWLSWLYELASEPRVDFHGLIERIELTYRAGGKYVEALPGPWVFRFSLARNE